nr:zinc finger MYM-type protein 1-like [Parasteatoda tepidariorum]
MTPQRDPFLARHLEKYGNPGSGHTSYLSSTIVNEFVELMADRVLKRIVSDVKSAKFFSIIVGSTPDLSHTDQLTFVVRGQSYDNSSNMADKYNSLQARIKNLNHLAEFVPCAAHSLNLVVVKAAEANDTIWDFFTFLQELFNFFSGSTHRWSVLNDAMKAKNNSLTVKSLANTRWCANAAATKALVLSYKEISTTLQKLSSNNDESVATRREASGLFKKIQKFETSICAAMWNCFLQQVDCTNKQLLAPNINFYI